VDAEGNVTTFNPSAERLFKVQAEAVLAAAGGAIGRRSYLEMVEEPGSWGSCPAAGAR
jgi:nitrogen fixation/metabolism regulation signal transduction histidine kinase